MAGKAGEKHALFRRSVAAADDKDRFAGKKLPVADGADGDAPTLEFLLALKAHAAGPGPCGRKDAEAADGALIGEDGFYIPFRFQRLCLRGKKFRAEALGLPAHDLRQLCPAGGEDAGIIGHLRTEGDLPAQALLFQHQHPAAGPGQIDGGRKPCRAAADNYGVIKLFLLFLFHGTAPLRLFSPGSIAKIWGGYAKRAAAKAARMVGISVCFLSPRRARYSPDPPRLFSAPRRLPGFSG